MTRATAMKSRPILRAAIPSWQGRRPGDPHKKQRRDFRGVERQEQGGTGPLAQAQPDDRRSGQPLQGDRVRHGAARGLGRAKRRGDRRPAPLHVEEQDPAGADARARPAADVPRRAGAGKGKRRRHRSLHGIRREHQGRGRRAGIPADGGEDRAEVTDRGRGGPGQRKKGYRQAGHRAAACSPRASTGNTKISTIWM